MFNDKDINELYGLLGDIEWRMDNLYHVKDKHGRCVKFIRNDSQLEFWHNMWFLNIILKDRQRGFSTLIAMFILDQCMFFTDTSTGIIDMTLPDAKLKLAKISYAYNRLPDYLKAANPLITDAKESMEFSNGSNVHISTSHRGDTLQILHVCLHGDTGIVTSGCRIKKIKDITHGDKVLTSKGSHASVVGLVRNKLEDIGQPVLSVKTFGYYEPLQITANHSVMVREHSTGKQEWKQAGELKRGDYIAFPVRNPSSNLRDGKMPFGRRVGVGARKKQSGVRIEPSFDLGWLCGFYLAEGTIRKRNGNDPTSVVFSIHKRETDRVVEKLGEVLPYVVDEKRRAGAGIIVTADLADSLTTQVTVNSKRFSFFLSDMFGCGEDKFIPDSVWKKGNVFMRGIIKGYFDGDGSYNNKNVVQVTSIRRQLIDQIKMMLISLRFGFPSIYHKPAGVYHGRTCKESWVLKITGAANWKFRELYELPMPEAPDTRAAKYRIEHGVRPGHRKKWRRGRNVYWSQVTGVEVSKEQPKFVYDIVLEKDPHNYTTVNGVVHNSEMGKIAARKPECSREIRTGALNTVAPGCYVFVESTAEGNSGDFFDACQEARSVKDNGQRLTEMDYKFNFFAWWMGEENEIDPEGVNVSLAKHKYFDALEKELGIELPARKRAWYVKKEISQKDDMTREFPSTPDEAFKAAIDGAYLSKQISFLRSRNMIGPFSCDPQYAVNSAWDFGLNDRMCIWLHQYIGLQHRLVGYISGTDEDVLFYWREMQKLPYVWGRHFLPHDAGHRRIGSTTKASQKPKTLEQILNLAGMRDTKVVPRCDAKSTAIQESKQFIVQCYFNVTECEEGITSLQRFRRKWNDKKDDWESTPLHDKHMHGYDAFETLARGFAMYGVEKETGFTPIIAVVRPLDPIVGM